MTAKPKMSISSWFNGSRPTSPRPQGPPPNTAGTAHHHTGPTPNTPRETLPERRARKAAEDLEARRALHADITARLPGWTVIVHSCGSTPSVAVSNDGGITGWTMDKRYSNEDWWMVCEGDIGKDIVDGATLDDAVAALVAAVGEA